MKRMIYLLVLCLLTAAGLRAGSVEKTFYFDQYRITLNGGYQSISFDHTRLSGLPGEPMLPYREVVLMLPPGETTEKMEIIREEETPLTGMFLLYPQQDVRPLSSGPSGQFLLNHKVYRMDGPYPADPAGKLVTQYMNGYAFALSTFTPLRYNPARGKVSYYAKVTVRITTRRDEASLAALANLSSSGTVKERIRRFAQNPEVIDLYPSHKTVSSDYQLLIITPDAYKNNYGNLINLYAGMGIFTQVKPVEEITSTYPGADLQEKIRNCITAYYQNNNTEYVILGGNASLVPYRGFYCSVLSQGSYITDENIPADLYYSALDGNWNSNVNSWWGEPGEEDLLPDISVARLPFDNATELANMIHKSVSYQNDPVPGEFQKPFMVGEHLYDNPVTEGGDYLDLLIDDQTANGYFSHGIPSETNSIEKMYDELISPGNYNSWTVDSLLEKINRGKQFIWHCGHSNEVYMMRLSTWDITNANFSHVNGTEHNYQLMYSHGCLCGAFENPDCIAAKCLKINNFLAAGVFNSRYGWFNEGTTEGPSEHLNREFVSALYHDTTPEKHIGTTHLISKIKTAPWVTAPGQWEPGALRWCDYCCNVLGDVALSIRTEDLPVGIAGANEKNGISVYPNPTTGKITLDLIPGMTFTLVDLEGRTLYGPVTFRDKAPGVPTVTLDLGTVHPGNYLCRVTSGNTTYVRKITIVR